MQSLFEGEKRTIECEVKRRRGSGTVTITTPERRILDQNRAVVTGYDWAAATWNESDQVISAMFDSTAAALSAVGRYYMQFRGVIGADRPETEIVVEVREWGP